jgi:hypothetical protein
MITAWQKTYQKLQVSLHGKVTITGRRLEWACFRLGGLLDNDMVNHTYNFIKRLVGASTGAEWYVKKANVYRRELTNDAINDELSGCWRCTGRQQGICDCCSHMINALELQKSL